MPGSASHLWRDDWEAKGQGWGCPVCHCPGLEWGTRSLVVQMWVTGACGYAVWVSMCPSVRPCCVSCSPMGGTRTTQTSTPGSSLPGSPRTPSAGDLVGASAGSGATPVPDAQVSSPTPPQAPAQPFHRYRQCWCQSPLPGPGLGLISAGAAFLLPGAGTGPFSCPHSLSGEPLHCSPAAGASVPAPLSGATSPAPSAAPVPVFPRRCRYPPPPLPIPPVPPRPRRGCSTPCRCR